MVVGGTKQLQQSGGLSIFFFHNQQVESGFGGGTNTNTNCIYNWRLRTWKGPPLFVLEPTSDS